MTIYKLNQKKYGVTLMETLVYLGLFGIFFLVVMQFLFFLNEFSNNAESRLKLNHNSIFLSQHVKQSFGNALSIDRDNTIEDNDTGRLRILMNNNGFNEYYLDNNKVILNKSGTASVVLTSPEVGISRLRFELITNQDGDKDIGVKMLVTFYSLKDLNTTREIETLYII